MRVAKAKIVTFAALTDKNQSINNVVNMRKIAALRTWRDNAQLFPVFLFLSENFYDRTKRTGAFAGTIDVVKVCDCKWKTKPSTVILNKLGICCFCPRIRALIATEPAVGEFR